MTFAKSIVTAIALSAGFTDSGQAETIPERLISDLQQDLHLTEFQAAGVAGNLARETGNFRYMQEINPLVQNSRGGIGYSQWTGVRRKAYEAWAGDRDLTAYETNYGYLLEEMTGEFRRVTAKLKQTDNQEEATRVFMKGFLRPSPKHAALHERINYANAYLDGDFSGAGCQATHDLQINGRMMVVKMCDNGPVKLSQEIEDAIMTMMLEQGLDRPDVGASLSFPDTIVPQEGNQAEVIAATFSQVQKPFDVSFNLEPAVVNPLEEPVPVSETVLTELEADKPNMG